MSLVSRSVTGVQRLFYNLDGPWYRRGIAEAAGSLRYSRPALFGMDRRLEELMPWSEGRFLEAGAHDGYTQSNTYFLERHRGWSGILVEPVPELRAKCRRRRPRATVLGCALVGPEYAQPEITVHFGDLMSTVGARAHAADGLHVAGRSPYSVAVPARTLSSILDVASIGPIDALILDLEGHELEALRGLDLNRHAPRFMLIEALTDTARPRLDELLAARYELVEMPSQHDLLYRRVD